ncbi:hypothetical protein ACFXO9_31680 [Nocardia tengchongensis]|uniref:hypothetical protein n=1 Tax=Nocardia tengchongensis TaxID=2055889 RepID=UPI0036BF319A
MALGLAACGGSERTTPTTVTVTVTAQPPKATLGDAIAGCRDSFMKTHRDPQRIIFSQMEGTYRSDIDAWNVTGVASVPAAVPPMDKQFFTCEYADHARGAIKEATALTN